MTRATLFRAQIYPLDYNSGEMASLLGRPGANVILRILLFLLLQLFSVLAGVSIHSQLSELDGDQYGALNSAQCINLHQHSALALYARKTVKSILNNECGLI